jgi:hypothetical protein
MMAFFKRYNRRRLLSLGTLIGIFLLSLLLVGWVHSNGKQISKCTLVPNHLVVSYLFSILTIVWIFECILCHSNIFPSYHFLWTRRILEIPSLPICLLVILQKYFTTNGFSNLAIAAIIYMLSLWMISSEHSYRSWDFINISRAIN